MKQTEQKRNPIKVKPRWKSVKFGVIFVTGPIKPFNVCTSCVNLCPTPMFAVSWPWIDYNYWYLKRPKAVLTHSNYQWQFTNITKWSCIIWKKVYKLHNISQYLSLWVSNEFINFTNIFDWNTLNHALTLHFWREKSNKCLSWKTVWKRTSQPYW